MRLFRISSHEIPTMYVKAENYGKALEQFAVGMSKHVVVSRQRHPSFRCEEITTLEQLMRYLPIEFVVSDDAGF